MTNHNDLIEQLLRHGFVTVADHVRTGSCPGNTNATLTEIREWAADSIGPRSAQIIADYQLTNPALTELAQAELNAADRKPLGRFVLEIEPGNAAMLSADDVADTLEKLAAAFDGEREWRGEGSVLDDNGNTVGRYTFHDHNDREAI